MAHLSELAVLVTLAALAGACGDDGSAGSSAEGADRAASSPSAAAEVAGDVAGCAPDSAAVTAARRVAEADLDGDGTPEEVRLTTTGSECSGVLFAEVGDGFVWGRVPPGGPPVRASFGVGLGEGSDLLVTRQEHPRGGFQVRVLARSGDRLVELEREGGETLVPFVATDVLEHPVTIDCERGALVVTEAVAHEPPGVRATWDVRRTTYEVADGEARAQGTEEIADNVGDAQLEKDFPELGARTMFAGCERR
jgi:hypothetical protein